MWFVILKQYKQFALILQNIVNTRNDIINRQNIRREKVNNDSSNNIFMNSNDFPDHGLNEETGYYEKNNYINQSYPVLMISSELNNEEDGGMHLYQQIPLLYTDKHKLIFYISKRVSNIITTDNILHKYFY